MVSKKLLTELADALFSAIDSKVDFFASSIVIVPNILMEQWLKSHWLRTRETAVLMNVEFKTLTDALPDLVEHPNYRLIKGNTLKKVILSVLTKHEDIVPEDFKAYYGDSPVKLNDAAKTLASLLLDYYKDDFQGIKGWEESYQRKIYEKVLDICKKHHFGTLEKPIAKKEVEGTIYLFGFTELDPVYRRLINECPFVEEYRLEVDDKADVDYSVCRAPSMVREVEVLHSKICELLLQGARMPDFLVVAPSISEYANAIERVFSQNEEAGFPNIPYSIRRVGALENDATAVLKTLWGIAKRGFCTRLDFHELCSNPIVMEYRGIDDAELENWMDVIVRLNVFREHPFQDDWTYIRKRLLLSKLSSMNFVDNAVSLGDADCLPYANIGFNDESIVRFVSVVDDLVSFAATVSRQSTLTPEGIDEIKAEFDKWFLPRNGEGEPSRDYARILSSISVLRSLSLSLVPTDVLFYSLLEDSGASSVQKGQAFAQGITFADFDPDTTYAADYVFFLGASSDKIPAPIIKSELDLRGDIRRKDLDKAFRLLYQNAGKEFWVSYVFEDLKTEEEFYLSPIVTDFNKEKGKCQGTGIPKVPLDETRPCKELFTRREFSGKAYYKSLFDQGQAEKDDAVQVNAAPLLLDKVTLSQMKDYLSEPLEAKANRLFGQESELGEDIRKEWEPFALAPLEESVLLGRVMKAEIEGSLDNTKMFHQMELENAIPAVSKEQRRAVFEALLTESKKAVEAIREITGDNFEVIEPRSIEIPDASSGNTWTLTASQSFIRSMSDEGRLYFEFKAMKKGTPSKFMPLYIAALMDIAVLEGDGEIGVTLVKDKPTDKKEDPYKECSTHSFSVSPGRARDLLNRIRSAMGDYSHNVLTPVDAAGEAPDDYSKLRNLLGGDHPTAWKYFKHKRLFDLEKDLGYDRETFDLDAFRQEMDKHLELIVFLGPIKQKGDQNGQ